MVDSVAFYFLSYSS